MVSQTDQQTDNFRPVKPIILINQFKISRADPGISVY